MSQATAGYICHFSVATHTNTVNHKVRSTGETTYCRKIHAASPSLFSPANSAITIRLLAVGVADTVPTTRKKASSMLGATRCVLLPKQTTSNPKHGMTTILATTTQTATRREILF